MKYVSVTPRGLLARRRFNGTLYQRKFPLGTEPEAIRQWLLAIEVGHRSRPRAGTFAADAKMYLAAVKAMPTYAQRKQHIDAWVDAFGPLNRSLVTPAMIRTKLHAWRTTPRTIRQRTKPGQPQRTRTLTLSAASCNKLRTALMHFYSVLDGRQAFNPAREVPRFQEAAPLPRAVSYAVIAKLLDAVPVSKSRARLMVLAYTGIPQAEIMRIAPGDVDLAGRVVAVHGRRKGRGTAARLVPLSEAGVSAFRELAARNAWGRFSQATLRQSLRRACAALGVPPVTPYALRHSFGTEIYRRSGDIRATQVLMGHSTPQLTHRYTLAAVDPRLQAVLETWKEKD